MKLRTILVAVLVFGATGVGELPRAEAQQLYRGSNQNERAVSVSAGYLPGGPVESGFGGAALVVEKYAVGFDVGLLHSRSPDARAFGLQFGVVPLRSEEEGQSLYTRVGTNVQTITIDLGSESSHETLAGGLSMTVGLPLRGENVLLQPMGAFGLSLVPEVRREFGFGAGEPEVTRVLESTASAAVAFGVYGDEVGFFVEPLLTVPLSRKEREVSYGVGGTLVLSL